MARVSLQQFTDNSCNIPSEVAPNTYGVGTTRWLYFIDREHDNPRMNLRDLVLLPCNPDEIERLYCVTLGIVNAPGATAAGTRIMREFGLALKFEQAYDSLSGDVGSKTCVVVFPPGKRPEDFDAFVGERVKAAQPGAHLIRRASERQVSVGANYSAAMDVYFGHYALIRRYLSGKSEVRSIDKITIQGDPTTINETPKSTALRLTDAQRRKIDKLLTDIYGEEHGLEGRFVQVSCDIEFEALSFSFLDPDDILCFLTLEFGGDTDEVNAVVEWLGNRGVDFRQYHIVANEGEAGYEFRLLCDLAQTDLHLFNGATLRELLFAELDHCLRLPGRQTTSDLRNLVVDYKHKTLTLYNNFTERDRFNLIAVLFIDADSRIVSAWPHQIDDPMLVEDVVRVCSGDAPMLTPIPLPQGQRRYVLTCPQEGQKVTVAAVYDNDAPTNFTQLFRHFCHQPPPLDPSADLTPLVRSHLLRGLRYDFLLSREKFETLSDRDRNDFRVENDARFSSLGWSYIEEKWTRDRFAFRGNLAMAQMVGAFLADHATVRQKLADGSGGRLRILDVGPGVGALTTTLALRRNDILWNNLEQIDLVFMDSAQPVLDLTRAAEGFRELPRKLLEDLQLLRAEDLKKYATFLNRATYIRCDVTDRDAIRAIEARQSPGTFDIVYSGFCHHHMNRAMKAAACEAMMNFAADGAFVGIVDESLTYKQFLLYRIGHSLDQVKIATESYFASYKQHVSLLGAGFDEKQAQERAGNKFYAFWGQARGAGEPARPAAAPGLPTPTVFISYAHKDEATADEDGRWHDRLMEQLRPLEGRVRVWSDRHIETGERWHESIAARLRDVNVAVLLVSPAFLASAYIRNSELPVLLKYESEKRLVLLPVIVRQCMLAETTFEYPDPKQGPEELSLSVFQAANAPSTPLSAMSRQDQDRVLVEIVQRILQLAGKGAV